MTFHLRAKSEIFTKSLLSCSAVSAGSEPEASREQSSAKIKISVSRPSTMSFIYIRNSNGPSLDPCGTPVVISIIADLKPSTTVHCFLLERYDLKSARKLPEIPTCSSLEISPLCQTLSKAALMSKKHKWAMLALPQLVLI